ncbi:serine/threonine-protein kinase [Nocardia neocaledoniensis]|uniref:serine/threonine-protein kinase n=1 Tax=Nocardia neocaledoniensis TaxID=236511 RepID=UPI002456149D|nr:serine/threonine-protein kinase [Nocardia neocaledoniensis]
MLATGDVFAGYAIERQLGRGGMGSVYLARHPRLPRQIALKLLNPELFSDNEIRARFEREADLAAQLEHPNIVTVYDRGIDGAHLWISMQFVDGVDAATIEHPVPAERALRIIEGTAAALDHAHRNGVLHRDVKPANILLADNDGKERVLLTDFGIARPRDDVHHLTQTGTFTATLAYASPEQLTGAHLDHRSDQYSLACTLYALLTGTTPFEATNPVLVIQGHLQSPPPPLRTHRPDLPEALDGVLARALAKRPADRFDSCAEFAAAARRASSGAGAQPTVFRGVPTPPFPQPGALPYRSAPQPYSAPLPPVSPWRPAPTRPVPARRTGGRVAVVVLTVLLVALGGSYWVWREGGGGVPGVTDTQARRDIAAMATAFPRMVPSGEPGSSTSSSSYLRGTGYGGRQCDAYADTKYRAEVQWEQAFHAAEAKWDCEPGEITDTAYSLYGFPTVESAKAAIAQFQRETTSVGSATSGTRTDDHRAMYYNGQYSMSVVVSTFSDPGRERWVLVFNHGWAMSTLEKDMPVLLADIASFPLG